MSATPTAGQPFEPAFCRRSGCLANTAAPFCAGCGADIAAYLQATTASHPVVAEAPTADDTQQLWSGPTDRPHSSRPIASVHPAPARTVGAGAADMEDQADGPPRRRPWREPIVLASFTLSCAAGAVAAVAAGMV